MARTLTVTAEDFVEALVQGIYLPIIVFAGLSCYLLCARLLWPAWREKRLDVMHYALGISCSLSLASSFGEAVYYGVPRWLNEFDAWNRRLGFVGALKLLVLGAAVFAMTAINNQPSSSANLYRVAGWAGVIWLVGIAVSLALNY